jgi:hypothetical protein
VTPDRVQVLIIAAFSQNPREKRRCLLTLLYGGAALPPRIVQERGNEAYAHCPRERRGGLLTVSKRQAALPPHTVQEGGGVASSYTPRESTILVKSDPRVEVETAALLPSVVQGSIRGSPSIELTA